MTQIQKFKTKIESYLSLYRALGVKYVKSSINKNKVQERLISEYTLKLLENIKSNHETRYAQLREKEHKLKPHTKEHTEIVMIMNKIRENLNIIKGEIVMLENNIEKVTSEIEKDLKLHNINDTTR